MTDFKLETCIELMLSKTRESSIGTGKVAVLVQVIIIFPIEPEMFQTGPEKFPEEPESFPVQLEIPQNDLEMFQVDRLNCHRDSDDSKNEPEEHPEPVKTNLMLSETLAPLLEVLWKQAENVQIGVF